MSEADAQTRAPIILLLEKDSDDLFIFRRALNTLGFAGDLRVAATFARAREYIEGAGEFADRSKHPLPQLIVSVAALLDGRARTFFQWVRSRPSVAHVPCVLFTCATPITEGVAIVTEGARAFMTKSPHFQETQMCVAEMLSFLPASPKRSVPPSAPIRPSRN